jgi:tetratricopeptide (TPR) repeat protein
MTGPRSNLAALLEQMISEDMARYQRRLTPDGVAEKQQEVQRLRRDELKNLARDAKLLPDSAPIQYRYGLSLYLHDEREEAEIALKRAVDLEPESDQFLFAVVLFYQKYKQYDQALSYADKLIALRPDVQNYRDFRNQLRKEADQAAKSQDTTDDE